MLKIAIAKSPEQIDTVLRLRSRLLAHAALDGQGVCLMGDRMLDRFDTFPTTLHLIAIENNQTVGSLRLTQASAVGHPLQAWEAPVQALPSDLLEDSQNEPLGLPNGKAHKQMICDLFCLKPDVEQQQTFLGLVLTACYLAISENMTELRVAVPIALVDALKDIGFTSVSDFSVGDNADALMLMQVNVQTDLDDSFIQFSSENELQDLIHAYGCALYLPGEAIIRAGAAGNCAFVITSGEVEVRHPGSDTVIDTMGIGDVFGELALLTNQVRSADIIAKTPVRTMILEKTVFVEHLLAEPTAALKMLTSMGHRMKSLIDYCNSLPS